MNPCSFCMLWAGALDPMKSLNLTYDNNITGRTQHFHHKMYWFKMFIFSLIWDDLGMLLKNHLLNSGQGLPHPQSLDPFIDSLIAAVL